MATLVLTAVGTALGGPIGGLIGAIAGQRIDGGLLGKGRQGPRLSDLRVQASSYGTPIPALYGLMRVAGTVIWATDLVEHRERSSAGKGQPKVTTYSYSVSMAVALSSRPIIGVRRIWAEGNLLRGAAGDFKARTGFRLHPGTEDQPVDPLIAAAEGPDGAPAYRGIAYAVFEDLDLSNFGNRIPSLTFEVEADAGDGGLRAPLAELLGAPVDGGPDVSMAGYAVAGGSRADAVAGLTALADLDRDADGGWHWGGLPGAALTLTEPAADRAPVVVEVQRGDAGALPHAVSLSHFDPARDYQLGVQQAAVIGGDGRMASVDLPATLAAGAAQSVADLLARRTAARRTAMQWPTGFAALAMTPGAAVLLPGEGDVRRIAERRIEGATVRLGLQPDEAPLSFHATADGGRAVVTPDLTPGTSIGALFDLPAMGTAPERAQLVLAASGTGAGWRSGTVSLRASAVAPPLVLGLAGAAMTLGQVVAISGGTPTALLVDTAGQIDVALARGDMDLTSVDDAALLGGANLMAVGDEILQFGIATPLGAGQWRLRRLLRGRFGTEDAISGTTVGVSCVLLADNGLFPIASDGGPAVAPGGLIDLLGVADSAPLSLPILATGRAVRPLAPTQLTASRAADGGLTIRWVRRSRLGFGWSDEIDAPLDAGREAYRVAVGPSGGGPAVLAGDTSVPQFSVTAAQLATWAAAQVGGLTISVRQIGDAGLSPAAQLFYSY